MEQTDLWVQDALDLIEWANGDPATSEWAKKRAEQGHPKPFGLKYLGLGNEEKISPEFAERFRYIYKKVREAHPDSVIVGTAGPGSHPGNPDYDEGWKLAKELQMPWPKACICCMWSVCHQRRQCYSHSEMQKKTKLSFCISLVFPYLCTQIEVPPKNKN